MGKQKEIHSRDEIQPLLDEVRKAAERTASALAGLTARRTDALELLRLMKFTPMAWSPLSSEQPLNIIEQINQTWSVLVTLRALPFLFERHADARGFRLSLGPRAGTDIESLEPNVVAAETFAAVDPNNNDKLSYDQNRLVAMCPEARARYVFFASPKFAPGRHEKLEKIPGIQVWAVDL